MASKENTPLRLQVKVLAFGIARDILGRNTVEIELPANARVADLQALLYERYPALARLTSLFVAVNEVYAEPELVLAEGDEVALIPPVSGG